MIIEKINFYSDSDKRKTNHYCIITAVLDDVRYFFLLEIIKERKKVFQASKVIHCASPSLAIFVTAEQLQAFASVSVAALGGSHDVGDRGSLELPWYFTLD